MQGADAQRPQALGSRYELEERLGIGAMGEVWRAVDLHTGQHLAAKVLRAEYARDADIVTRFIQERSILLNLTHPNIVRVRDLVVEGERLAIVMDLVEGGDLREHLREHGPVAAAHAVPLACVILDALASAHASGCLHRDVKPDNVLLVDGDMTRPENARLSDFSIARLAHESTVQSTGLLGTPGYMPPELFRDGQFSGASDVYATGVLLYELLGGRTPFAGAGTAHTIGFRHVSSAPPALPVPDLLWSAIEQMLAKEPRARLSAAETAAALRALPAEALSAEPLPVQPVPESWESIDHTVLRGSLPGAGHLASADVDSSGTHQVLRRPSVDGAPVPTGPRPSGPPPGSVAPDHRRARPRHQRLPWIVGGVAALVVAGLVLAVGVAGGDDDAPVDPGPAGQVVSAQLTDPALPIGLTVSRAAVYDAAADELSLTLTYAAGSAPLEGPFLEVFPRGAGATECPLAAWAGRDQTRNSVSTTGVETDCTGYLVTVPALEAQDRQEVEVTLSGVGLDLASDPEALQGWLESASVATSEAVGGASVRDDQFPVQRVTGIWVEVSPFSVRVRQSVRVEVGPQFSDDSEGPAFFDSTDVSGTPSRFLQQIAGGFDGVRLFSDCPVLINDRRQVSALRTSDPCPIEVEVGKVLTGSDDLTITGAGS